MAQQRILVTGAKGNLGQDLMARLSLFDTFDVVGISTDQMNLAWEPAAIHQVLSEIKPDIILNTAAFTQVDAAETEFDMALKVNAQGPEAMAAWLADHGGYLVHISTDYVFDGTKGSPYLPTDATHPINRYGVSKRAGEESVLRVLPERALVIRTSWLYGAGAKNFVPFVIQSAQAQTPIRVANDQWGTPTWTGHLCKMILSTLSDRPTGIRHGCSSGQTSRYEQALFIVQCLGLPAEFMTPVPTEAFHFPAERPLNTAMVPSFESVPDWQAGTLKFLETRGLLNAHV